METGTARTRQRTLARTGTYLLLICLLGCATRKPIPKPAPMYTLMPPTPPPPKKALVLPKATNVFLPHLTFPVGELHSPPPWYFQELLGSADLVHWKSLWYYVSNPLV